MAKTVKKQSRRVLIERLRVNKIDLQGARDITKRLKKEFPPSEDDDAMSLLFLQPKRMRRKLVGTPNGKLSTRQECLDVILFLNRLLSSIHGKIPNEFELETLQSLRTGKCKIVLATGDHTTTR